MKNKGMRRRNFGREVSHAIVHRLVPDELKEKASGRISMEETNGVLIQLKILRRVGVKNSRELVEDSTVANGREDVSSRSGGHRAVGFLL